MKQRVVFDTNSVVSALLFSGGRLSWLRSHWGRGACVPMLSRATAAELVRVLAYPKFQLAQEDRLELLGDYLPFCETLEPTKICPQTCRDPHDQMFLDLAFNAKAAFLITGDHDLLALSGETKFLIQTPENYRRIAGG